MLRQARAPKLRTMREFAEQEIIIPDGPFKDRKFNCDRQPFSRVWFDLCDDKRWNRKFAPGCTQSGKSLTAFVIPVLYHLFEQQETVIAGVPDMDMAADKWREDLLPVIERTKYRELIPTRGPGSRGGKFDAIQFLNGATLKFMSGGGGDKSRAAFTSRVLCVTEVDGFDFAGEASREADKFTQLEARTLAYGENKCIYGECTVSIETGRVWTEWTNGTKTDLHLRCPHCRQFAALEREHLVGWQDADSEEDARKRAAWACPKCGELWTEADRRAANLEAVPVHRDQTIDGQGVVHGEPPATRTLGFRWHAVHNFFYDTGYVGGEEWIASRAVDEENAEKKQRQFLFTLPHVPAKVDHTPLSAHGIMGRTRDPMRGLVPADTEILTLAIDIGKFRCHWLLLAFRASGAIHIVDYGRLECLADQLGEERGILTALTEFREVIDQGWIVDGSGRERRQPDQIFIDSRYQRDTIFQFCRESGEPFLPVMGFGVEQRTGTYHRPTSLNNSVKLIGDEYHIVFDAAALLFVVQINADAWKSWAHARLAQQLDTFGAMTVYKALPRDHLALAKQLTAEKRVEEFIAGKGPVTKWVRVHRNNHWFDTLYLACAAGHFAGYELLESTPGVPAS